MWIARKSYLGITMYSLQVSKTSYIKWMQMSTNNYIPVYYTWIDLLNWCGTPFPCKKCNLIIQDKRVFSYAEHEKKKKKLGTKETSSPPQ